MLAAGLFSILVAWPAPDAAVVRLLTDLGADVVITPPGPGPVVRGGKMRMIAEIAADTPLDGLAAAVGRARAAGYDGAAVSAVGDEAGFRSLLGTQKEFVQFVYLKPEQLQWNVEPAQAVLKGGMWPGLQSVNLGEAAATERPWLNGNMHLYAYLRSLYPQRAAVLSYPADEKTARYEGAEIALAEAFGGGGSVVLALPEAYRAALLKQEQRAVTAWKQLGQVAAFLKQQGAPAPWDGGARTGIVAAGLEDVEEILNLAYRNNLCPQVLPAGKLGLAGRGMRIVAAVNVAVSAGDARELTDFAKAGGIVLTAPPVDQKLTAWWMAGGGKKVRQETGRDVYALGKGTLYAYRDPVLDPSEFGRDLRELSGLDNPSGRGLNGLDLRVWNSSTVLGSLHRNGAGQVELVLASYGRWIDGDFLVGLRGEFAKGAIEETGTGKRPLDLMQRGGRIEFNLKGLKRVALIQLQEKGR